jgi:protein tyrosine phosphatase (PTP) superfamily phosphohydrolase (DUF442 family)
MGKRLTAALWSRKWPLLLGGLLGGLLAVAAQVWYICLGGNFHTVIPGRVYRGAQPSPEQLETVVKRYGIRTVVNLRGHNRNDTWYHEESATARRLGVALRDIGMSGHWPTQEVELRRLVDVLLTADLPLCLHCQAGADRAGLAAAFALLLLTDSTLPQARGQLALRFGHNALGSAGCNGRLLDRYEEWLQRQDAEHRPQHLRRWVYEAYRREDCW